MRVNQIIQFYKNRGLNNYKLQNIEDILIVHGVNVLETKGYENLTEKNKVLFKSFIVNFLNAWGLEARSTIFPTSINYVLDVEYLGKENEKDDYYVVLGNDVIIMGVVEGDFLCTGEHLKNYKSEDYKHLECIETNKKYYLRFDYEIYDKADWQHVIKPAEWY